MAEQLEALSGSGVNSEEDMLTNFIGPELNETGISTKDKSVNE